MLRFTPGSAKRRMVSIPPSPAVAGRKNRQRKPADVNLNQRHWNVIEGREPAGARILQGIR